MHLHILPAVALLSQDRAAIQPRQQQAEPHVRTSICAAMQLHIALACCY